MSTYRVSRLSFAVGFIYLLLTAVRAPVVEAVQEDQPVLWVWSGAVTPSSAIVKAKVHPDVTGVRLALSSQSDFEPFAMIPVEGFAKGDEDGVMEFSIQDLEADSVYYYAVEVQGQRTLTGRFRTFAQGPMSFRIGFASCAATGSNHEVWTTIRKQDPLFFLHMGDFHYEDIKRNDPELYRHAFDRCLTSPRQGALYRSAPIVYMWDDHDFGPNDADGTAPGKPAALKTYQQYVPHYPLVRENGQVRTIQQAFTVGRVRFIVTDVRSERTPVCVPDGPSKTVLGEGQRKWLEAQFLDASQQSYALVIWVNVVPWITKSTPGTKHGWEPFSWERRYLADRIKELGLVKRLLILSGDAHMVAFDDGTNSNYASDQKPGEPAFPVAQAAPIHRYPRVKGGPYSHGTYAHKRLFGLLQEKHFGLMEVQDNGAVLEVVLRGIDSKGQQLEGMELTLVCDKIGCETK